MPRYPHIYFESKKPGKDAVFSMVKDIGKPGCKSPIEVAKVACAQLLDWIDGWTKNHNGRTIKFTNRIWAGRYKVLLILSKKYGGRRVVKLVQKIKKMIEEGKLSKRKVREVLKKCLKARTVNQIIKLLRGLIK